MTDDAALIDAIDRALPQTQCTRCGYPDCRSYAVGIARGEADINQCPPGGAEGIERLAGVTGRPARALDLSRGAESPRMVAIVREEECIGCTLCLQACPVDCILGGPKQMHTVMTALCTGCELCVPVCPVDCISLENGSGSATGWAAWSAAQAETSARRHAFHRFRLQRAEDERNSRLAGHTSPAAPQGLAAPDARRAVIEAALARARARKA